MSEHTGAVSVGLSCSIARSYAQAIDLCFDVVAVNIVDSLTDLTSRKSPGVDFAKIGQAFR